MKKRVLITGGSGFVGYHLIAAAISSGYDVVAAVRTHSSVSHLYLFDIKYVYPEYDNVKQLTELLKEGQYHYIIHASGATKAKCAAEYNLINADFSKNLALAVIASGISIEKFVFVSSLAAIGPLEDLDSTIQDNTKPNPITFYGASKLLAESFLLEFANLPLIIIRPTAVYGPREKDIFILIKSIERGFEPYIGGRFQKLSFVYVGDLAKVIIQSLTSSITRRSYNISDGHQYDRYAIAQEVKVAINKKAFKIHIPIFLISFFAFLLDQVSHITGITFALNREKIKEITALNWSCNINSAERDLGFKPTYSLTSGIKTTIQWYIDNKWL